MDINTSDERRVKTVLGIDDKSSNLRNPMETEVFKKSQIKDQPSMCLKVSCDNQKNIDSQSDKKMYELSLDIDKVVDMNIGSNCHVYITILLLPEAKRELVQRTKKGNLSDIN